MSKYYDKTAASFKSVTIDTKVLDAQKILINSNPNDINQRDNLLDVLNGIDVTPSYTSYQYIDYCEKSNNTGECSAVKLHANLLPHDKNIKAIRLTVANTVNTETWLVAYLVDASNNFTSIGKSINSNTWSAGDQVEWEFDKAFQIPEGSYLQLYIADANSTISSNNVTRPSYKIALYVANYSGDNQDSVRYDGTWYNQRRVYVQFKEELKQELSQYLDDKLNELESNLDQVQEQVDTNTQSIDSIGQDVEINSENIESLRQDVNSLFTYQDAVRDVNTMQGTLDNATIHGIQYSKKHFGISGTQISKVTLPYNTIYNQSNTGYLVAQVFGRDNQLMVSYYSEGTHTFSNAGPAVFDFKDAYIAANYKFIRFVLVANKTVALPTSYNSVNSNCLSFRARPIKWSDSFTFDDDECLVYSNNSTGTQNWLVGMTIDYKERGAQLFITREEADSLYITKTEDNEHILNVLNEEVDVSYAQGWFNLETNTNAWRLRIGQYPDIVAPDNGETLEAAQWVQLINQADIPFEAYAITSVKVGIKAKQPGDQYCVSFKMYYPDNTLVTDQITYSGDTLELSGDLVKRIDYLKSLNNQQQSESNVFDKTVYLKEGAVVSNDIVINGSKLLLANGASIQTIDHAVAPGQGSASNYLVTQTELEEKEQELKQYTQDTIQQNLQQLNTIEPSLPTRRYLVALSGSFVDFDCSRGDDWCLPTTAVIGIPASAPTGVYRFIDNSWLSFWTKVIFNKNKIHKVANDLTLLFDIVDVENKVKRNAEYDVNSLKWSNLEVQPLYITKVNISNIQQGYDGIFHNSIYHVQGQDTLIFKLEQDAEGGFEGVHFAPGERICSFEVEYYNMELISYNGHYYGGYDSYSKYYDSLQVYDQQI